MSLISLISQSKIFFLDTAPLIYFIDAQFQKKCLGKMVDVSAREVLNSFDAILAEFNETGTCYEC